MRPLASLASKSSQIPLRSPPDDALRKQCNSTGLVIYLVSVPLASLQTAVALSCRSVAPGPGPESPFPFFVVLPSHACARGWFLNSVTCNAIKMLEEVRTKLGSELWRHIGRNAALPKEGVAVSELGVPLP